MKKTVRQFSMTIRTLLATASGYYRPFRKRPSEMIRRGDLLATAAMFAVVAITLWFMR